MSEFSELSRATERVSTLEDRGAPGAAHPSLLIFPADTADAFSAGSPGSPGEGVPGDVSGHRQYRDWPDQIVGGGLKRAFDLLGACLLLLFFLPVMALAALAVWMQDGGSPFFAHVRVGVGGRPFRCFKLRSMVKDSQARLVEYLASNPAARAEWARSRKLTLDPRTTSLGRFLRKSSLDELPQLLNVIRGDMSLVGPRPVVADELTRYDLDRIHYLRTRPGLTGLWQVTGRSTTSYKNRVALDKAYTLRWSFLRDIGILLSTLPAVLLRRGAA